MTTTTHAYSPSTILRVDLDGGDVGDSWDAICVDCDLGAVSTGAEWSALVRSDRLEALLHHARAQLVGSPRVWDGDCFGDGNGGTVERQSDGSIAGDGLNAPALQPAPSEAAVSPVRRRLAAPLAEVVCDRCGRTPGVCSDGWTPYCYVCSHECTFTRAELEAAESSALPPQRARRP